MTIPSNSPKGKRIAPAGFTLPAVLVVVGALLVLAVGILLVASIERSTARSFVDRERAELAARSGLEDIRAILTTEAANDEYLVIRSEAAQRIDDSTDAKERRRAPFLFIARGRPGGDAGTYDYAPLFSATARPLSGALAIPVVEPLLGTDENQRIDFTTLPHQDKVRAAWLPVEDEKGLVVARYAYWVEDLQGRLDPTLAGNEDGNGGAHIRTPWPFPAAGINPDPPSADEPALNQVPLFAFDPAANDDQQGSLGKTLFKNRQVLISPDSSLAAAGFSPPLARLEQNEAADPINPEVFGRPGQLVDKSMRAVEEGLFPGIQPYRERAMVPYSAGIDPSVHGQPKLNLNKLLATGGNAAVEEMASWIRKGLPKFDDAPDTPPGGRKGSFPDDYIKTLAANAIDYADGDGDSTTVRGEYRGLDSYPLVSEFLMTFKWTGVPIVNGRKLIEIKVATYVELWNMSDKPVTGTAQLTYETGFEFSLGAIPDMTLADMSDVVEPKPVESEGYRWFPPMNVSLRPNQYSVFRCGEVTYRIDVGPASVFVASPFQLDGETYGASKAGYRMRWNGRMVDESRGHVHRNSVSLHFPVRPATRATVPGHSYKLGPSTKDWRDNMGDPRMSAYLLAPQDANSFPQNYSPNRRNIRFGSIYGKDPPAKPTLYGRVMPSEWPDGGHNSFVGTLPISGVSETSDPNHPNFINLPSNSPLLNPPVDEAPFRVSNLGRFYSATELGRVYDPIMWAVSPPSGPNLPYGDVLSNTARSTDYGGGNTLRIGRPEHPKFDEPNTPGLEAWRLLDLFHAGISRSENAAEREGALCLVEGNVNLNTASRETLRALAYGALRMDPKMAKRTSENHVTSGQMGPPVSLYKANPADMDAEAARIAGAIISLRSEAPLVSPAAIAEARILSKDPKINNRLVFGNKDLINDGAKIHRTDSAAEEVFARVYEASTVRSRNFRVWVVGQALAPSAPTNTKPEVLAEVRRAFTVFADPGDRMPDGAIDPAKVRLRIRHENDF